MRHFKSFFIATATLVLTSPLFANTAQENYLKGLAYLNGDIGTTTKTIEMPNCPYANCDEAVNKNGMREIEVVVKDHKSAIKHLDRAIDEGSLEAQTPLLNYLSGLINYKDNKPSGFLIDKMKEQTGFSNYKQWIALMHKVLDSSEKNNLCKGLYFKAEALEKGWVDYKKDEAKSQELYKKSLKHCSDGTYEKMMAEHKIKE